MSEKRSKSKNLGTRARDDRPRKSPQLDGKYAPGDLVEIQVAPLRPWFPIHVEEVTADSLTGRPPKEDPDYGRLMEVTQQVLFAQFVRRLLPLVIPPSLTEADRPSAEEQHLFDLLNEEERSVMAAEGQS